MDASPSLKKDWVLNQEAFDKLLAKLDTDRERAGERYENLRQKLITFFSVVAVSPPKIMPMKRSTELREE